MAAPSKRNALVNVTVEDTDALDCGVCWLPLKPPIFQCQVGHVFCLPCRDKLVQTSARCPVCRGPIVDGGGGYRRNHGMEKLLESIRVPCPNAARGCSAKLAYYDRQSHVQTCPCRPCHCPAKACGFAGSKAKLLQHFTAVHRWPLTKLTHRRWQEIQLRHGFNVLDVGDSYDASKRLICLLLVVSSGRRLGRAIYPVCLDAGVADGCDIDLDVSRNNDADDSGDCQRLVFRVVSTDLSNGLPGLEDRFQFVVPKSVRPDVEGGLSRFQHVLVLCARSPIVFIDIRWCEAEPLRAQFGWE